MATNFEPVYVGHRPAVTATFGDMLDAAEVLRHLHRAFPDLYRQVGLEILPPEKPAIRRIELQQPPQPMNGNTASHNAAKAQAAADEAIKRRF